MNSEYVQVKATITIGGTRLAAVVSADRSLWEQYPEVIKSRLKEELAAAVLKAYLPEFDVEW